MSRGRAAAVRVGAKAAAGDAPVTPVASVAGGQAPPSALRPVNLPIPVPVEVGADGEPAWLLWRGLRLRVVAVLDRWRIDDEWWRTPISRLYRQLQLADDRLLTVFEDLEHGGWFAQRYRFPASAQRAPTRPKRRRQPCH